MQQAEEIHAEPDLRPDSPENCDCGIDLQDCAPNVSVNADPDDTELMVKVADEIGGHDDNVDYDPFQQKPIKSDVVGSSVLQTGDDGQNTSGNEVQSSLEEPEWMFIGGNQRHKRPGASMSAETSNFIMKKSSVAKVSDGSETVSTDGDDSV